MPDLSLRSAAGDRFDLRERADGRCTLLSFGYTSCPDVCPVYLANLGRAIDALDPAVEPPLVLFVGVDIERDTPRQLERHLQARGPMFVGLTGTEAEIGAVNEAVFNPPVVIGAPDRSGEYSVEHAAGVLAFTPDLLAHRRYPPDTRSQSWVRDLPALARGRYR